MNNFRGLRKVVMVDVCEGEGVPSDPSRIVHYIFDLEQHGGSLGGLVGRIDPRDMSDIAAPDPLRSLISKMQSPPPEESHGNQRAEDEHSEEN